MNTFEQDLSSSWVEVLNGGSDLHFDAGAAQDVEVHFSESGSAPASDAPSNDVQTWASCWDFSATGMSAGVQRIWVRGIGKIVGVR